MPIYFTRTPFFERADEIVVRGERVRVGPHQIIVWVSLTPPTRMTEPNPAAVPFPAILDTGHTHSLAISERHLAEWAGLRPGSLRHLGELRDRARDSRIPRRAANLWLHGNNPGERDRLSPRPARFLKMDEGIAVYPGADFPRLPLVGLRAIAENNLVLTVNGPKRAATLRTPLRWWPFG